MNASIGEITSSLKSMFGEKTKINASVNTNYMQQAQNARPGKGAGVVIELDVSPKQ